MTQATEPHEPHSEAATKSHHHHLDHPGLGRSVLNGAPGVLVSVVLHGAVLLGATLFYIEQAMVDDDNAFITQIRRPDTKVDPTLNAPPPQKKPPTEDPTQPDDPALVADPGSAADSSSESGGSDDGSDPGGGAPIGVSGLYSAGGSGSGGYRSGSSRARSADTKARPKSVTDKHLKAALAWLARHQEANGSWSTTQFHKNCGRYGFTEDCAGSELTGNDQYDVGVTGLALLAFLGGGYGPNSREPVESAQTADARETKEVLGGEKVLTYGEVVKRACKFLVAAQDSSGRIGPEVDRYIYNHLLGSLALTEAYGITRVWLLRQPALKAIRFLLNSRTPGAGWRYTPRSADPDSSVTAWAVAVLRAAEAAGLERDESIYKDLHRWFDQMTVLANVPKKTMESATWDESKKFLLTAYLSPKDAGRLVSVSGLNEQYYYTPALTAGMAISSVFLSDKSAPKAQAAVDTLLAFPPARWTLADRDSWRRVDFYYWYNATHALSLVLGAEDARWKQWSEGLRGALFETQHLKDFAGRCAEGSWEPIDRWSCEGGRVYATAIAAMTIEAYYRFPKVIGMPRTERPLHVDDD